MNAQLLGNVSHALACWRTYPPSHISFDRLAITTHCSAPSSPLVGSTGRVREASSFLAKAGSGGRGVDFYDATIKNVETLGKTGEVAEAQEAAEDVETLSIGTIADEEGCAFS